MKKQNWRPAAAVIVTSWIGFAAGWYARSVPRAPDFPLSDLPSSPDVVPAITRYERAVLEWGVSIAAHEGWAVVGIIVAQLVVLAFAVFAMKSERA